jgi:SAM-dependent methyltransferase
MENRARDQVRRMWDEPTLKKELHSAMERVEAMGVSYPPGHKDLVAGRYSLDNVPYPYIIRQIGESRIRKHFLYPDLFRSMGALLDYGCGTGDAIRHLVRDGYPKDLIAGFDVNDASLRIGFDLYLDRDTIAPLVTVAPSFPAPPARFDRVYSGSVIHVLGDDGDFTEYLQKAHRTLKPGGTFFGSTLGLEDSVMQRPEQGPPRLMRGIEVLAALEQAGFSGIRIVREEREEFIGARPGFCLYQFAAEKA